MRRIGSVLDSIGVKITGAVGTMWCALAFACLALVSLPDAIRTGRPAIVSWVAQTFLQLVLLSVIMVGQQVQGRSTERIISETHELAEESRQEILAILREVHNIEDDLDD